MIAKTEKLYYTDQKLSKFEGTVVSCEAAGERGYAVILDRTAFFPEKGGQYADTGTISGKKVTYVSEKDGIITHFTDGCFSVGDKVWCELDFDARYAKMQCHSGEHIVSGIMLKLFGLNNVGFHLGHDDVTLDFDGVIDEDTLNRVEMLANRAVWDNLRIRAEFPSAEELKKLDYRSKLELSENVRIVTVEGIDVCACCAPHVERTGEIGAIKLFDMTHYKGGVRIHMLCGSLALLDYRDRYEKCRAISNLLSVKQSAVESGVQRLLGERDALKSELSNMRKLMLEEKLAALTPTACNIVVFEKVLDADHMREYAKTATEFTSGLCAVFINKGEQEYSFIIASKSTVKPVFEKMKEKFIARGGGNDTLISGVISAGEGEIREFFEV